MTRTTIGLIARQFCTTAAHGRALYSILLIMALMLGYAAYSGYKTYTDQNNIREHYQRVVRESWEGNPDKHPHRMAHYGSFAFRLKHPLSQFDFGLESFTGNAVYLEAHKQNSVNFSEATFSTGLLRFGEISLALLLQLILPLFIVFLGFSAVSADREGGALKIMLIQGASWRSILVGKSLGLMALALLVFVPVACVTFVMLLLADEPATGDTVWRYILLLGGYLLFLQIVCVITVIVSAVSASSKMALMNLLGIWLLLAVLLPRTLQALGSYVYPSPSKIEFETAVEEDVLKEGDSHNPNDPHYSALKDSVLRVHHVDSIQKLPFNYSGFVMREGERISANIYDRHLKKLLSVYKQQNSLNRVMAFVNPYVAIRNISMALSGTDFESYVAFQHGAEAYRYQMAQTMNELQMEYISTQQTSISHDHWKELPEYRQEPVSVTSVLKNEVWSFIALLAWGMVAVVLIQRISKTAKAL